MEPRRRQVTASGVSLSVLELGAPEAPPLVMLHGMRDVAWSLLAVARPLSERYRVLLPELRGHGDSDRPGIYSIDHFLFDLHRVLDALRVDAAALFGHSLGGQITARFSALFPGRVLAAVIVEGLGPPARPGEGDEAAEIAAHGAHLLQVSSRSRAATAAAGYRLRNRTATGQQPAPGSGARRRAGREGHPAHVDGRFADGELEARVRCFPDVEHVAFAGAGHMVRYDQPQALTEAVADFLERKL